MAYNLHSLIHILEPILLPQNNQSWVLDDHKPLIQSLLEKAISLRDVLETSARIRSSKVELEALETKIRDAAYKAEDIIESCFTEVTSTISTHELHKVIDEFDAAKEVMAKIVVGSHQIREAEEQTSTRQQPSNRSLVVGLDGDLLQLKDRLTGHQARLEIIPIVGMGGLGKTTLAQMLYDDPLVVSHFDTRAWVTISQEYNFRGVLLGLLVCVIGKLSEEILGMKNYKLADMLYKNLFGRRYLIIIDDMWSIQPLDDIRRFLPDVNNNSRIMVTTREVDVANSADPNGEHHKMRLLNPAESWQLLRQKVFEQEPCPEMLEKIGEKIVANCGGLPLAVSVVGGLLSTEKHNQEFWKDVADNTSSIVSNREQFSNIFSLSYDHLPSHLRPCLLYFGAFPEDYEIRSSKLIRLWVAEGFIKPIRDKSLEEAADVYLKSLVDRNLISVRQQEVSGRVKSCGIHDLLRDLCLKRAIQEKFFHIMSTKIAQEIPEDRLSLRRVSVHPSSYRIRDIYSLEELMFHARSFLCTGLASREILAPVFLGLRFLRVLDVLQIEFHKFPQEILQLVNLRYLSCACRESLPFAIQRLINLQTLVVSTQWNYVPWNLWTIQQLRHVMFVGRIGWVWEGQVCDIVNQNMQTLSNVNEVSEKFLKNFPNLRKLGISIGNWKVIDFSQHDKLHTLKCVCNVYSSKYFHPNFTFPPCLKKLSLAKFAVDPSLVSRVGSFPNLQVLKLKECSFEGEWEVGEGEFCELQLLQLEKVNLVEWKAEENPFPRLQSLVIRECSALEGIPRDIGDIQTLEMIELHNPSPGVAASAGAILEEQQRHYGNYVLQVREYRN